MGRHLSGMLDADEMAREPRVVKVELWRLDQALANVGEEWWSWNTMWLTSKIISQYRAGVWETPASAPSEVRFASCPTRRRTGGQSTES